MHTIKLTVLAILNFVQHGFVSHAESRCYQSFTFASHHFQPYIRKLYFDNVFLVPFDVIIGHVIAKVGVVIKVDKIYVLFKFG